MINRSSWGPFCIAGALLALSVPAAEAAEGSVSHYLAGLQGELGFALPPPDGLQVRNILWSESGEVDAAVFGDTEYRDVEMHRVLDILAASYGTEAHILGGRYSAALRVPVGWVGVSGDRVGTGGGLSDVDEQSFGLGDIELVPLQLNWRRGDFHFQVSQSLIAPTGYYDEDDPASVGRGYWSFDTVGAVTYYNPTWGTEVSAALGLMHNADSIYVGYHTANESHLDFAINQHLTKGLSLGIRGYRLNQLKRDRGDDTLLGPLEGFSRGIGAGFTWQPVAAQGAFRVSGSYMSDFEARDGRIDGDHAQLSVTWTF